MRNHNNRTALFLPEPQKLVLHQVTRVDVESGKRLIHEDDFRTRDERLCHLNALTLSAGKLMRIALFKTFQANLGEPVERALASFRGADTFKHRTKFDVFKGCFPRQKRILLKQISNVVVNASDGLPVD